MRTTESTVVVKDNVVVTVWEAGKPVKTYHAHNTWGIAGLNALRNWFAGLGGTPITHIAWVDTAGVERARDIVTQRSVTVDKTVLIRQYLPSATPSNGYTLNRIRAYNAQTNGTQFAEAAFDAVGVAKTANNQITVEWAHSFADGGS
jgi:hypothetical protein